MSNRHTHPRGRVVVAAVEMLARHGLNATSIREMTKRAEAPLGSTYHHFPGGKQRTSVPVWSGTCRRGRWPGCVPIWRRGGRA
jgi:hypothetical protein